MAFTADNVQGVFGEFKPALDEGGGAFSADVVQGVFGQFISVLDEASGGGTYVGSYIGPSGYF